MEQNFAKYLKKLGIEKRKPGIEALTEIITAYQSCFPFENISKVFYYLKTGKKYIPDFDAYLERAEVHHFGGTCYSNNYYLNHLLRHLGYEVMLCGADIYEPDVHMVNVVTLEGQRYLVDVGYAAPFFFPIPLDAKENLEIVQGKDKYVLQPANGNGIHEMQFYRGVAHVHGYKLKLRPREFSEFVGVIENSYRGASTFFNDLLVSKYIDGVWVRLHNRTLTHAQNNVFRKRRLHSVEEIISEVQNIFRMPGDIVNEVLRSLPNLMK